MREQYKKLANVGIYSGVFILILLLLYLFLGRPVLGYSRRVKAEFQEKQAKIQESEALIRSLPNPQKAIDDIEKKVQEFKDMGVSRRQLPRLIQTLAHLTSEENINVISIKPREDIRPNEVLPAGITKVYLEMVLNCPYSALGEYLKKLGSMHMTFTVEGMTVEKVEGIPDYLEIKKDNERQGESSTYLMVTLLLSTYMVWEL